MPQQRPKGRSSRVLPAARRRAVTEKENYSLAEVAVVCSNDPVMKCFISSMAKAEPQAPFIWKKVNRIREESELNDTDYKDLVLNFLFLIHLSKQFYTAKKRIEDFLSLEGRLTRTAEEEDFVKSGSFFIPEQARYDYISTLDSRERPYALEQAANIINSIYADRNRASFEGTTLLSNIRYSEAEERTIEALIWIFSWGDMRSVSKETLARIYNYLLEQFTIADRYNLSSTPNTIVRALLGVVEPSEGVVFDPACGSGNLLAQAGKTIMRHQAPSAVALFGQEAHSGSARTSAMTLDINGLEGTVYYADTHLNQQHHLINRCDRVVSNPPFNQSNVGWNSTWGDPRLFSCTNLRRSKRNGNISNANYLWVQYFYSYLNGTGRAGFVMPASASEARHSEARIRKEIISTGAVDVLVSVGSNFLRSTSIPITLWFLDKGKRGFRKDKILMIDARDLYRVVDRSQNDFSDEQMAIILATVWLYREESERYTRLISQQLSRVRKKARALALNLASLSDVGTEFFTSLEDTVAELQKCESSLEKNTLRTLKKLPTEIAKAVDSFERKRSQMLDFFTSEAEVWQKSISLDDHVSQKNYVTKIRRLTDSVTSVQRQIRIVLGIADKLKEVLKEFRANLKKETYKKNKSKQESFETKLKSSRSHIRELLDSFEQVATLQRYFPDGKFADVLGFCAAVDINQVEEQECSLNPARYVGTVPAKPVANRQIETLKESVSEWNQWRQRSRNTRPDLTGANLQNFYLSEADLSGVILNNANLKNSILRNSVLHGAEARGANFEKADMEGTILRKTILEFANFKGTNLRDADFHSSDLRDAQMMKAELTGANLSESRVLRTNFYGANLAGACIANWQIGDETRLDAVACTHIFRKVNTQGQFSARLPVDRDSIFSEGEFAQRFQILQSASETIDLTFTEGVDWEALFQSFQEVRAENRGNYISVQSFEQKSEAIVVRLEIDDRLDFEKIERRLKQHYVERVQLIEERYQRETYVLSETIDDLRKDKADLRKYRDELSKGMLKLMSKEQGMQTTHNYNLQNAQIAGSVSGSVQGDQIGGTINNYGTKLEDIIKLIGTLRLQAEFFPEKQKIEAIDIIEDLESDIKKKEPDSNKLVRRLKRLAGIAASVAVITGSTAQASQDIQEFTGSIVQIGEAINIPAQQILPEGTLPNNFK